MEEITIHNYEEWFVDYLDGRLDERQVGELMAFLGEHPALAEELNGVAAVSLVDSAVEYPDKGKLMKDENDIPGISLTDRLCIARMEKDLSESEVVEFDRRIRDDSGLANTYAAFLATRLPSESIPFPEKESLKRTRRLAVPWIVTAISSAALLILALILWPERTLEPTGRQDVAVQETEKSVPSVPTIRENPVRQEQPVVVAFNNQVPVQAAQVKDTVLPVRDFVPMNSLLSKTLPDARLAIPDPVRTPVMLASVFTMPAQIPSYSDEYLTLPQIALQLFREKILGQDPGIVRKTRFSVWELAGAGVDGINLLAGTEMKLDRQYDESGEVMAVSFNSRLLDVEAPVRSAQVKED